MPTARRLFLRPNVRCCLPKYVFRCKASGLSTALPGFRTSRCFIMMEDDDESVSSLPEELTLDYETSFDVPLTSMASSQLSSRGRAHTSAPSLADERQDRDLIAQVFSSTQPASAVSSLDLSMVTKKTRRSLKSLHALVEFMNLVRLDVANNTLTSLDGIECFASLERLCCSRNHLKRIDSALCSVRSLRHLDLSGNFVAHIPKRIAGLELLETLNLAGNNLSSLKEIDVLSSLANLHALTLSANPFCKLPSYRDYVICNVPSLETLDDVAITLLAREKSHKRFSKALFSKDACLREVGLAHESEQNRLREAQSALEAENLRLKGELQVKSKLLQNKSRAWSTATEQLLQLQQEVAMLNIDRRSTSVCPTPTAPAPTARVISPTRFHADGSPIGFTVGHRSASASPRRHGRPLHGPEMSPHETYQEPISPTSLDANAPPQGSPMRQVLRTTRETAMSPERFISPVKAAREVRFKDSACSPLPPLEAATRMAMPPAPAPTSVAISPSKFPARSPSFDNIRKAFAELTPKHEPVEAPFSPAHMENDGLFSKFDGDNSSRSARFPTFEDDLACPAYEDQVFSTAMRLGSELSAHEAMRTAPFHRSSSSPERLASMEPSTSLPLVSPSPRSSAQRTWLRQHQEFRQQTTASPTHKRRLSRRPSEVAALVDKELLVKQIQTLQSCKQSLVSEIAKEEALLHGLKIEGKEYADQIDRLEVNMQACWSDDPASAAAEVLDKQQSASNARAGGATSSEMRSPRMKRQREEEIARARLEMLRHKLRFAEDKEKEIEMTMVRMTKSELQSNIHGGAAASSAGIRGSSSSNSSRMAFDKEIFALTHKLQQVIVQKEEIHLEMSRLLAQMREQKCPEAVLTSPGRTSQRPQRAVSNEEKEALAMTQAALDHARKKHHDVQERIRVKQDMLATLVAELTEVENELSFINHMSPLCSPAMRGQRHRRSSSFELHQAARSPLIQDLLKCAAGEKSFSGTPSDESNPAIEAQATAKEDADDASMACHASCQGDPSPAQDEDNSSDVQPTDPTKEKVLRLGPYELRFKELLTTEMLDEIKQEIYDKLSQQFALGNNNDSRRDSTQDRNELHEAIAAALETQMKQALESYHKKRDDGEPKQPAASAAPTTPVERTPSPPKRPMREETAESMRSVLKPETPFPTATLKDDDVSWDHLDNDFAPLDLKYPMKYRFLRSSPPSPMNNNGKVPVSVAAAMRIYRACERLEVAETEGHVDSISGIDLDAMGHKRSQLKVVLISARDLPTTHLRTKNLDPYVTFEIVYPTHVMPSSQQQQTGTTSHSPESANAPAPGAAQSSASLRSRTKKRSMYPVWDEDFEFAPVHSLRGHLHVRVLNDRKQSREQLVGEARIPLRALVHQKRIVEWFALYLPCSDRRSVLATGPSARPCGGSVRLQLQLNFSRVERYKRAVDDLVAKYYNEYHLLPRFMEPIGKSTGSGSADKLYGTRPEVDDMEPLFVLQQEIDASEAARRPKQQQETLDDLEISLQAYDAWKAETVTASAPTAPGPHVASVRYTNTHEAHLSGGNGIGRRHSAPSHDPDDGGIREIQPMYEAPPPQFYCDCAQRRGSMGSYAAAPGDAYQMPMRMDTSMHHHHTMPSGPTRHVLPPQLQHQRGNMSMSSPAVHTSMAMHRAAAAMPAAPTEYRAGPGSRSRHHLDNNGYAAPYPHHRTAPAVPRRRRASPDNEFPECFDEYSPYHPSFQSVDPLDGGNNVDRRDSFAWRHTAVRPGGHHNHHHQPGAAAAGHASSSSRKTDLRIFKSPAFARRQPTTGFPERYIGLDNQTCERIKRMFGRMDSS